MNENNVQNAFFLGLLLVVTVAFLWLIRGFLQPVFWAAALAIIFSPMYLRMTRWLRERRSLAAVASVFAIVLIVILPLSAVGVAVSGEAIALYQRIDSGEVDLQSSYKAIEERLPQLAESLDTIGVDLEKLREQLANAAVTVSRFVASQAISIGQNALRITVLFFLMLYLLYFFLRDGPQLLDGLVRALPIGDVRERQLLSRFAEVSRATIKGTLVVGAAQGAIGGIAFALLGLGAPVLWGVVMAFASLLPAVGPALVWLPASIVLFASGRPIAALVLIGVGVLIIGLVDNLLRPILVGRDTRLPDYLILLSTLGGLAAFGLSGIVIGPIIAALFLSIWEMFQAEFGAETDVEAVIEAVTEHKAPPD